MRTAAVAASGLLGRRLAISRLVTALSVMPLFAPNSAPALAPPTADVLALARARAKATELQAALPSLAADDLPIYVTQFAALNLKPGARALAALAPTLDARAAPLAAELAERVAALSAAGRDASLTRAEAAATSVAAGLDEALALAAVVYALPAARSAAPADGFSTASYFGPFGCEGVGLKRLPDSNECYDPSDKNTAARE
jgi:uncharacterized protein YfiM (DUF2279 family)